MNIKQTAKLTNSQKEIIVRLWNAEYPQQINYAGTEDFDAFLNNLGNPQHFLLEDENGIIRGWLATFTREKERWFSVIVDRSEQKKGYGTILLNKVKEHENELNGWVIDHGRDFKSNGEIYLSPLEFYRKNKFTVLSDVRFVNEKISAVKIKWVKPD